MGMYTELIFGASLKKETPAQVIETIKYLVGDLDEKPENMDFDSERNPLMGASFYFGVHRSVSRFWYDETSKIWALSSRSNIKNYGSDIEKFLEWIKPWIESGSGLNDMYAIVMYEEDDEPTIYYLHHNED